MGKAVKGKLSCMRTDLLSKGSGFRDFKDNKFLLKTESVFNPIALRKAKIVCNFGLCECNRVKGKNFFRGEQILPFKS